MSTRILFRDSRGREGAIELRPDQNCTVGRGLDCSIRSDDGMVSRLHAEIRFQEGAWWIDDKGSANGTLINQVRVSRQALQNRDVIQCGSLSLRFIEEMPAAAVAPAPSPTRTLPPRQSNPPPMERATVEPPARLDPASLTPKAEPKAENRSRVTAAPGNKPARADSEFPTSSLAQVGAPPPMPDKAAAPSVVIAEGYERSEANREADLEVESKSRKNLELDAVRERLDREVADGKRLRAEVQNLRDRVDELKAQIADREERLRAEARVADELRTDATEAKAEARRAKELEAAAKDQADAQDRSIKRSQIELQQVRAELEGVRTQLQEAKRTNADGYKQVNEQVQEVDRLRSVISEQERMLEERRVGLTTLEETVKELRLERDKALTQVAASIASKGGSEADIVSKLSEELRSQRHAHAELQESSKLQLKELEERIAHLDKHNKSLAEALENQVRTANLNISAIGTSEGSASSVDAEEVGLLRQQLEQALARANEAEAAAQALSDASATLSQPLPPQVAAVANGTSTTALVEVVVERVESANDALYELRNQARIIIEELKSANGADLSIAQEAADAMVETLEGVKGSLRELRLSVEGNE